jgi:hypothetical protein
VASWCHELSRHGSLLDWVKKGQKHLKRLISFKCFIFGSFPSSSVLFQLAPIHKYIYVLNRLLNFSYYLLLYLTYLLIT